VTKGLVSQRVAMTSKPTALVHALRPPVFYTGRVAYSTVAYSSGDRRPDCGDRPAGWYDSACVLDGILGSQTDLPVTEHAVGTHGAKLANSARFDLVGLQLSSRIRDH